MLDLSGFQTAEADLLISQVNVVLDIELEKVVEDPDQPRQEFDEESLATLADDIRIRGVQTPIAVRPLEGGVYKIIHGARRYRAAKLAGLATIPLIVQSNEVLFDDYSQVAENTKRAGLHPMDIARFIQKRKEQGESNKAIAEKLGENPEYIIHHLALLDAPQLIMDAFRDGKIRGAQSVWRLARLHEKDPLAVERLLSHSDRITQKMIRDAGAGQSEQIGSNQDSTGEEVEPKDHSHADSTNAQSIESSGVNDDMSANPGVDVGETSRTDPDAGSDDDVHQAKSTVRVEKQVSRSAETTSHSGAQRSERERLQRPVVYGVLDGRPVEVMVFWKPTDHGLVWIKWEDASGDPEEVLADKVCLSRIEAR